MGLWSVIVYGRTKEADYRFLAIPDDFGEEEQDWARKYIHGTTVSAEELRKNHRWCLFKNDKHCVLGVTCMVKKLIGSEGEYEYMTKDAAGRSLHIFVGYVIQIRQIRYFNSLNILPDLENLELFQFKTLLRYLENLWELKDYELIDRKIDTYPYNLNPYSSKEKNRRSDINNIIPYYFIPCSEKENRAFVCPDNPENRHNLWENCRKFFNYPHQHIALSLCLGLSRQQQDVLQGPFSNATTSDTTKNQKLTKLPQRKSKVPNNSLNTPEADNRDASSSTRHVSKNSLDTPIKRLLYPISWERIISVLFISISILFILYVTSKNYIITIAIVISLLIGFYLGIILESSKTTDSRTSKTKNKSNYR